jgi:hypothetical protein
MRGPGRPRAAVSEARELTLPATSSRSSHDSKADADRTMIALVARLHPDLVQCNLHTAGVTY